MFLLNIFLALATVTRYFHIKKKNLNNSIWQICGKLVENLISSFDRLNQDKINQNSD